MYVHLNAMVIDASNSVMFGFGLYFELKTSRAAEGVHLSWPDVLVDMCR
jgi:hypothetical protein